MKFTSILIIVAITIIAFLSSATFSIEELSAHAELVLCPWLSHNAPYSDSTTNFYLGFWWFIIACALLYSQKKREAEVEAATLQKFNSVTNATNNHDNASISRPNHDVPPRLKKSPPKSAKIEKDIGNGSANETGTNLFSKSKNNKNENSSILQLLKSVVETIPNAITKAPPPIFQDSIETPRMTLKKADSSSKLQVTKSDMEAVIKSKDLSKKTTSKKLSYDSEDIISEYIPFSNSSSIYSSISEHLPSDISQSKNRKAKAETELYEDESFYSVDPDFERSYASSTTPTEMDDLLAVDQLLKNATKKLNAKVLSKKEKLLENIKKNFEKLKENAQWNQRLKLEGLRIGKHIHELMKDASSRPTIYAEILSANLKNDTNSDNQVVEKAKQHIHQERSLDSLSLQVENLQEELNIHQENSMDFGQPDLPKKENLNVIPLAEPIKVPEPHTENSKFTDEPDEMSSMILKLAGQVLKMQAEIDAKKAFVNSARKLENDILIQKQLKVISGLNQEMLYLNQSERLIDPEILKIAKSAMNKNDLLTDPITEASKVDNLLPTAGEHAAVVHTTADLPEAAKDIKPYIAEESDKLRSSDTESTVESDIEPKVKDPQHNIGERVDAALIAESIFNELLENAVNSIGMSSKPKIGISCLDLNSEPKNETAMSTESEPKNDTAMSTESFCTFPSDMDRGVEILFKELDLIFPTGSKYSEPPSIPLTYLEGILPSSVASLLVDCLESAIVAQFTKHLAYNQPNRMLYEKKLMKPPPISSERLVHVCKKQLNEWIEYPKSHGSDIDLLVKDMVIMEGKSNCDLQEDIARVKIEISDSILDDIISEFIVDIAKSAMNKYDLLLDPIVVDSSNVVHDLPEVSEHAAMIDVAAPAEPSPPAPPYLTVSAEEMKPFLVNEITILQGFNSDSNIESKKSHETNSDLLGKEMVRVEGKLYCDLQEDIARVKIEISDSILDDIISEFIVDIAKSAMNKYDLLLDPIVVDSSNVVHDLPEVSEHAAMIDVAAPAEPSPPAPPYLTVSAEEMKPFLVNEITILQGFNSDSNIESKKSHETNSDLLGKEMVRVEGKLYCDLQESKKSFQCGDDFETDDESACDSISREDFLKVAGALEVGLDAFRELIRNSCRLHYSNMDFSKKSELSFEIFLDRVATTIFKTFLDWENGETFLEFEALYSRKQLQSVVCLISASMPFEELFGEEDLEALEAPETKKPRRRQRGL